MLAQPPVHVVLVVLLAPQQAGQRLAHHSRMVGVEGRRDDRRVERVGLLAARGERPLEAAPEGTGRGARAGGQPDADRRARPGRELEDVVGRGLRASGGVERRARHHVVVDRVLRVHRRVGDAEQPLVVGLVLAEQQPRAVLDVQPPRAKLGMGDAHGRAVGRQRRALRAVAP